MSYFYLLLAVVAPAAVADLLFLDAIDWRWKRALVTSSLLGLTSFLVGVCWVFR